MVLLLINKKCKKTTFVCPFHKEDSLPHLLTHTFTHSLCPTPRVELSAWVHCQVINLKMLADATLKLDKGYKLVANSWPKSKIINNETNKIRNKSLIKMQMNKDKSSEAELVIISWKEWCKLVKEHSDMKNWTNHKPATNRNTTRSDTDRIRNGSEPNAKWNRTGLEMDQWNCKKSTKRTSNPS